jgi:hypothetical protein
LGHITPYARFAGQYPEDAMAQPERSARGPGTWTAVTVLLVIGVAGTLAVPAYARSGPMLGGFPFFYWYQLIWIPLVAILAGTAYFLLRRTDGPGTGRGHDESR